MAEENLEKNEEKQEPQKPKKEPGELGLKKVLIIGGGFMAVQVILITVIFKFFLAPGPVVAGEEAHDENSAAENEKKGFNEGGEYFEDNENIKYASIDFDPIISSDFNWVIPLKLGFKLEEIHEGEDEGGGGGHGGDDGYHLPPKLVAETKSRVNAFFGDMPVPQLKSIPRDSIRILIKKDLKPLFKVNDLALKSVTLEQFTPTLMNE